MSNAHKEQKFEKGQHAVDPLVCRPCKTEQEEFAAVFWQTHKIPGK